MIYIGVDVGGTKTEAIVVDREGVVLSRYIGGPGNYESIGEKKAAQEIKRVVEKSLEKLGDKRIAAAFFGMAGVDHEEDKKVARRILKAAGLEVAKFDNDGRIALRSCFHDDVGIAVSCGTGGISYAGNGNELNRIGGYSWSFGERLGSYLIAGMVTAAVMRAVDGRDDYTILVDILNEKLGMDIYELRRISRFGLMEIKDKVPVIINSLYEAYEKHDPIASKIIFLVVEEIVRIVKAHDKKLKIKSPAGVCLTGTFFRKAPGYLVKMVQNALGESFEAFVSDRAPVVGAAHLALEAGGVRPDQQILERIALSYKRSVEK